MTSSDESVHCRARDSGEFVSQTDTMVAGPFASSDSGYVQTNDKKRSLFHSMTKRVRGVRGSINNADVEKESATSGHLGHTFVDADAMKEKVRLKLSKPKYNVFDLYHDAGCAQSIGKSGVFDKATLSVIAFNALWIAIDTDMNDASLLFEAEPIFIIVENFFCLYFSFEWIVRFLAFRRKLDGLKDAWFVFDSFMVAMMVLETWIFSILVAFFSPSGGSSGAGNAGIMRLARLLRLSRMARMGKLLRVMPELLIMIKGMKAATRSVFFTLFLLVIIMYVFAIAFVQLSKDTEVGDKFFEGVPLSMYTLLVYGIFLDNVGHLMLSFGEQQVLAALFLFFVLLGALTVMNMLVGVLCEVVSAVAATEREEMLVTYVNEKISTVMAVLDTDGGGSISKKEFLQILDYDEAVRCLNDVGVDVFALIDLADYIFEDDDAQSKNEIELDFPRFMQVVLQLRGTNQATVKDIVDLRKFMRLSMQENFKQTASILEKLSEGADLTKEIMHRQQSAGFNLGVSSENMQQWNSAGSQEIPERGPSVNIQLRPFEVEGGPPPTLPPATPNGQLLTWVPIAVGDMGQQFRRTAQQPEDVALTGAWEPVGGSNSDDQAATLPGHQKNGSASQNSGRSGGQVSSGPRVMRVEPSSAGEAGRFFDDTELRNLQSQLEFLCGQLVSGLNEAIHESANLKKPGVLRHVSGSAEQIIDGCQAPKGTYVL